MSFDAGSATSKLFLDVNPFRQGFLQAESLMKVFPSTVTNFMASPLLGFIGIAGQVGGAMKNMLTEGITTGVKLAASFEQAEVSLGTMLGGAAEARKVLGDLSDFASSTPFELPELVEATKKLTAFGIEQANLIPTLTSIGDISAGLGIQVGELAEIYGKARVQGRLFMEDINQLAGRGIPIQQELARQFGVTGEAVRELVSGGSVTFDNLQEAFRSMTAEGSKFGGMMDAQSKTLNGLFSTLKDGYNDILRSIGTELVEAFDVKGAIKSAADYLMENKGAIVAGVKEVTASVVELASMLRGLLPVIVEAARYARDAGDVFGITDPNNRVPVKDPTRGIGDPLFLAGLDKTDLLADARGNAFLSTVARGQLEAGRALSSVENMGTKRAGQVVADIGAATKAYEGTLAELDAMMSRPAREVSAEEFEAMVAQVNAYGVSLRTAAAEMEKFRDKVEAVSGTGGAAFVSLNEGLAAFTRSMDAIRSQRSSVYDIVNSPNPLATGAPGSPAGVTSPGLTAPSAIPPLAGGSSPIAAAQAGASGVNAQPFASAVAAMTRGVRDVTDGMADVREALSELGADLVTFTRDVLGPMLAGGNGAQGGGNGQGSGGPLALGNVNVTTAPFNMDESTSQVATKLRPTINSAFANLRREFQGAIVAGQISDVMR